MGADIDAGRFGEAYRAIHDDGIAGMIAAGEIGGGDDVHDPGIIGNGIGAKAFTEIGVEIDLHQAVSSRVKT